MKFCSCRNIIFFTISILFIVHLKLAIAQQEDITKIQQEDTTDVKKASYAIPLVLLQVSDSTIIDEDTIMVKEVHPQDSPEDRGFLITSTDGKAQLRIRGSIRLNGAYDFNGLQNKDNFDTYAIPVGDANISDPRFFMNATQTRIGIEAERETGIGEVFMRIGADFRGNSNLFRLRQAFGRTKYLLVGQTWSTFGDVSSIPSTVDIDGPNSSVSERTIQIRYINDISDDFRWAVAVESPDPEIIVPDSIQSEPTFQSFPDIVGRISKLEDWGDIQFAGIIRSITTKNKTNETQILGGFGGLLSGKINLDWRNKLLFQVVGGRAIARFIQAITGHGLDVVYNPNTGDFEVVTSYGGFLSYGHYWKPKLFSYITIGVTKVINKDFQSDDTFSISNYISGNLFWEGITGIRTGIEYSWGRRENKNGESGNANRFSFIVYYDF
jgi:hypothetical protein